jgi:glucose/mannose-6-phosphate isomerase
LVAQLFLLVRYNLIDETIINALQQSIQFLDQHEIEIQNNAKQIAEKLKNKIPLIYTGTLVSAMGIRWKQQINENAKRHCFTNLVPEMNHNELVAFEEQRNDMEIILLRNNSDHPRIQLRFELMKDLLADKGYGITELFSAGESYIEQMFYFIHLGDWVSFYLAENDGNDPLKIEILDALKRRLG